MEPIDDGQEAVRSTIFFGEDGLRAGWCLLLFSVIAVGLGVVLSTVVALLVRQQVLPRLDTSGAVITPGEMMFGEGLPLACIAVAAWVMSRVERRSLAHYGMARMRAIPDFFLGLGWGLLALSALIGVLWTSHAIAFGGLLLSGGAIAVDAAEWAVAFLLVGLFEEFLFRGYLQFTLARAVTRIMRRVSPQNTHMHAISFWTAALLLSGILFAATHVSNHGETLLGIVAVAVAGFVFVFSLWRTGSLWWAIGFHSAWDWAQSFLYGTPDSGTVSQGRLLASHAVGARWLSGGTDGPEGSVLVIPVLLVVGVGIYFLLPKRERALR